MQNVKVEDYSVQKLEWKLMDRGDCITSHFNAVGKNLFVWQP